VALVEVVVVEEIQEVVVEVGEEVHLEAELLTVLRVEIIIQGLEALVIIQEQTK
jgi:hypothetical protein